MKSVAGLVLLVALGKQTPFEKIEILQDECEKIRPQMVFFVAWTSYHLGFEVNKVDYLPFRFEVNKLKIISVIRNVQYKQKNCYTRSYSFNNLI